MDLSVDETLPAGIREQYEAHKVTRLLDDYENPDCIAWDGAVRVPTRPGGIPIPHIYFEGRIYSAALVAWALHHQKPYPYAITRYHCGDLRCVNGLHISPKVRNPVGRPRKTGTIEETLHYKERYAIVYELLKFDAFITSSDILSRLREADLGGKTKTILAIVSKVRADLKLPARIPSRRKVTT